MTVLTQAHMLRRIARLLGCKPDEVEKAIIDMLDDQRISGELRDMQDAQEIEYWSLRQYEGDKK